MNETLTLPRSIQTIIKELEANENLTPSGIEQIIKEAKVSPEDLDQWMDHDHPKEDGYGRKLVVAGNNYEVMVMSWRPGDFSAIHDHGYTMWGAVQIFGEAEHAIFEWNEEKLVTQARWKTNPGDTVPVTHELIHQMGNAGQTPFVSLHVYGTEESVQNVTGEARIFLPDQSMIQRVNGGVFFDLKGANIVREERGPGGDLTTVLRNQAEALNQHIRSHGQQEAITHPLRKKLFSKELREELLHELKGMLDEKSMQVINPRMWQTINLDLQALARIQKVIKSVENKGDSFGNYAPLYDAIIGESSLPFMSKYLKMFSESTSIDWENSNVLSVGCGTGLVESWLVKQFNIPAENLLGIDISASMIAEAKKRINAQEADILNWEPERKEWDVIMSGLNVYQYIPARYFEEAVAKTAGLVKKGGYFVGDLITPDHMRWYPNLMVSSDEQVFSLRTPERIMVEGAEFQESEIINIDFRQKEMEVHYAGKHRRHLPTIKHVYETFSKYFGAEVQLIDAVDLTTVNSDDETCPSTRYVVIAQKK